MSAVSTTSLLIAGAALLAPASTALCERLGADQTDPCTDLLQPFDDETEVRAP